MELAILATDGSTLFESLINPQSPISAEAQVIHGLTETMLSQAPTLSHIWHQVTQILTNRLILSDNAAFDQRVLNRHAARDTLPPLNNTPWDCIMEWYTQFCGICSDFHGSYRWQPLGGNHRAAGDAQTALHRIQQMATADEHTLWNGAEPNGTQG